MRAEVILSHLTVLNVLIGVVCTVMTNFAQAENERNRIRQVRIRRATATGGNQIESLAEQVKDTGAKLSDIRAVFSPWLQYIISLLFLSTPHEYRFLLRISSRTFKIAGLERISRPYTTSWQLVGNSFNL